MRKLYLVLSLFSIIPFIGTFAQETTPVNPTLIGTGTYWGLSKPLRELPKMTDEEFTRLEEYSIQRQLNRQLRYRSYPYAATALPKGPDAAWQKNMGANQASKAPEVVFEGMNSPYFPPDENGVAGPNHYMQTINTVYAIYDKAGTLLAGPTNLNLLFGNVPGANRNDGDPIIMYDEQADRWVVTEFSIPFSGQNYILMAVSQTNDPTGSWHQYSFPVASMPDYPKFSVWRDGYYMGVNNSSSNDIYVFERAPMLSGGTAQMVGFNNAWRPASVDGFMCVPPVDNDGPFAPTGTPGLYIAFNDDAIGGGDDQLWIYELAVDWSNLSASTFTRIQQVDVIPFDCNFGNNWDNINQPGTGQELDGIPQVIMNAPQYRNFGSYQTIVCCHTVDVDGTDHAGIRWYELRKTGSEWTVRQTGTYAPDQHSRWMGSIMLNGSNTIALGFSISSTTEYPGIRFCGQSATEYNAGSGIFDIEEDTIHVGSNSQTGANRWGDYSLLAVDPADDETFWYTNQYVGSGNARRTKIASFKFNAGPVVETQPATDITSVSAILHGTINPLGIPTNYHFEYGTIPFSLSDSTEADTVGSGMEPVPVSAEISGLESDKKYYFRVVAENPAARKPGLVLNFTTLAQAILSVDPPNQNVGFDAGNTEFTVTSNTDWTVESGAGWCTVTPTGTGNGTIVATFTENTAVETRIANITVSAIGVASQTVTVTQAGVTPYLTVTPPNRDVTSGAGSTTFEVLSNTLWTVVSDAAWCTATSSGAGNGTVTADFSEFATVGSRMATLTITVANLTPVTVTVTQQGPLPTLNVTPLAQNVTASPGSTAFEVASNTDWTATSDASWCAVTSSGTGIGTLVADYLGNGDQARTANITVTVASLPVQVVQVNQAKAAIGISEDGKEDIRIFPNPTKGLFTIESLSGNKKLLDVTVQDLTGRILIQEWFRDEKHYTLDLSGYPRGAYHIIIKNEGTVVVKRLMVVE